MMGAEILYSVRVLVAVEETILVSAVTGADAREEAEQEKGVIRALGATPRSWDDDQPSQAMR